MAKNHSRRDFLRYALLGASAVAIGGSFEEHHLLARTGEHAYPARETVPDLSMPKGKIGDLEISRLICGGNLISGYSHSRDLMYVSELVNSYNTPEKVMETWQLCEERGINTVLSDEREKPREIIRRYRNQWGGNIQWIAEGHPKSDDITTNLQTTIDAGADAIYIQGGVGDRWVKLGRVDLIAEAVEFIKQNGLVAGVGGHSLEVPKAVEAAGIEPDFYMKTLHSKNYWSFNPADTDYGPFHADTPQSADNVWCTDPDATIEFMRTVERPWIAYKTMAAGAIHPRDAFPFAFENGADFICVGLFDFQVLEDSIIARDTLAGELQRERPWYG